MHVLFVCTGNICRSPTAERLAIAYASGMQTKGFTASSAGTRAVVDSSIHPYAASVLEGLGAEASDFAARQLTSRIANDADLVITMTKDHRNRALQLAPRKLHSTFTLTEASLLATRGGAQHIAELSALRSQLAGADVPDIPDPIAHSPEFFATVGSQIAELLPPVVELCLRD